MMRLKSLLVGFSMAAIAIWISPAAIATVSSSAREHLGADGQEQPEHPEEAADEKEHPEHPEAAEGKKEHPEEAAGEKEHPEHPQKGPASIESVAKYLEGWVADEVARQGGWGKIRDEKAGIDLELRLDKIHRERLAKTDKGTYFVCADFVTASGKVYDLDFWVKETKEGLTVAETTIHKEEGKARYSWIEKDGVWSQVEKP